MQQAAASYEAARACMLRRAQEYRGMHSVMVAAQVTLVPYLIDNPGVGYVQARWAFTNPDESYLTKARQCMSSLLPRLTAAGGITDVWHAVCRRTCCKLL